MKLYIALGDSISIDRYPEIETGIPNIGAASLFSGDLRARHPDLAFRNLTADGATTEDVLREQLPRIQDTSDPAIVTITVGGNDLLVNLGAPHPPTNLVEGMMERLTRIVDEVIRKLPNALVLAGTVYDPSDNTGTLNGRSFGREAEWLARFNEFVRHLAGNRRNVRLADIHAHFMGHGITASETHRWYWSGLIFEPNAEGARQVRTLWMGLVEGQAND